MDKNQLRGIEIKSRAIDEKAYHLKNETQALKLKINASFKINIASVEEAINDIERRAGLIKIEIPVIQNEIKPIAEGIIHSEKKSKMLRGRIKFIERAIKRSAANILAVEGKIKVIRKKVSTASPQHPYIKHEQFEVTH